MIIGINRVTQPRRKEFLFFAVTNVAFRGNHNNKIASFHGIFTEPQWFNLKNFTKNAS